MTELEFLHETLVKAKTPEDIFGETYGDPEKYVTSAYRRMSRIVHEDHYTSDKDQKLAHEGFILLAAFKDEAIDRIVRNIYGTKKTVDTNTVTTKKRSYEVGDLIVEGNTSNVYSATYSNRKVFFKVAKSPKENALLEKEAQTIKKLSNSKYDKHVHFVPKLVESFSMQQGKIRKTVNVFPVEKNIVSLYEIGRHFDNNVDMRDTAWMINRLLEAVGWFQREDVIHPNLSAEHCMMRLDDHGMYVIGWTSDFKESNCPEVTPQSTSNIYNIAKLALWLTPKPPLKIKRLLNSMLIVNPARRPDDAWAIHKELGPILKELYGPARFRPLTIS